ncbi:hypothetical protein I4U23_023657 [Adineta vaga]|nr:hypothetical protein I4U23_023657 [Adineta vaga]
MKNTTPNQFESLSNELLLEIFEYLDAYNLYQCFHGLNQRINTLLRHVNLSVLIQSQNQHQTILNEVLSFFNPSQIRILSANTPTTSIIKQFVSLTDRNLHSLHMSQQNGVTVHEIVQCLSKNNDLKDLRIDEIYTFSSTPIPSTINTLFIDHASRFQSLNTLSLCLAAYKEFPQIEAVFPQLRRLAINRCYWSEDFVKFLHHSTPNLRSLQVSFYSNYNYAPPKIFLEQIRELDINCSSASIHNEAFLINFPALHRLRVICSTSDPRSVCNGEQWAKLIEKYVPHLKQLTLDYDLGADSELVESFTVGDFWSTKKINVIKIMSKISFRCPLVKSIYFGSKWHFKYSSAPDESS